MTLRPGNVERPGVAVCWRALIHRPWPTGSSVGCEPKQFSEWAYQIRCNLMHRGKSAFSEAELVRLALLDLHDTLRLYLLARVPTLHRVWAAVEPDFAEHGWRLKVLFAATGNATTSRRLLSKGAQGTATRGDDGRGR